MSYQTFSKDKRVAVVAVLLVVLAAYFIYRSWQSGQPHVTKSINLAGQGPKSEWLRTHGKPAAGDAGGAQASPDQNLSPIH